MGVSEHMKVLGVENGGGAEVGVGGGGAVPVLLGEVRHGES